MIKEKLLDSAQGEFVEIKIVRLANQTHNKTESLQIPPSARNVRKIKAQKSMYWPLPNLQNYMLRLKHGIFSQDTCSRLYHIIFKPPCDIHLKHVSIGESDC